MVRKTLILTAILAIVAIPMAVGNIGFCRSMPCCPPHPGDSSLYWDLSTARGLRRLQRDVLRVESFVHFLNQYSHGLRHAERFRQVAGGQMEPDPQPRIAELFSRDQFRAGPR